MVSYSLAEEFPDLSDRFTRLSHADPEFAAQLASFYAVDAQIMTAEWRRCAGCFDGLNLATIATERVAIPAIIEQIITLSNVICIPLYACLTGIQNRNDLTLQFGLLGLFIWGKHEIAWCGF
jgi:hypothetical protein